MGTILLFVSKIMKQYSAKENHQSAYQKMQSLRNSIIPPNFKAPQLSPHSPEIGESQSYTKYKRSILPSTIFKHIDQNPNRSSWTLPKITNSLQNKRVTLRFSNFLSTHVHIHSPNIPNVLNANLWEPQLVPIHYDMYISVTPTIAHSHSSWQMQYKALCAPYPDHGSANVSATAPYWTSIT
jgi:hypothetical protein